MYALYSAKNVNQVTKVLKSRANLAIAELRRDDGIKTKDEGGVVCKDYLATK
jgi:hypothetical protein